MRTGRLTIDRNSGAGESKVHEHNWQSQLMHIIIQIHRIWVFSLWVHGVLVLVLICGILSVRAVVYTSCWFKVARCGGLVVVAHESYLSASIYIYELIIATADLYTWWLIKYASLKLHAAWRLCKLLAKYILGKLHEENGWVANCTRQIFTKKCDCRKITS